MKKNLVLLFISFICLVEIIIIYKLNQRFLSIPPLGGYLTALVITLFFSMVLMFKKFSEIGITDCIKLTFCTLSIVLTPIIYYINMPNFSYEQAIAILEYEEDVIIIKNQRKMIGTTDMKNIYYMKGIINGGEVEYYFDLYSGKYGYLNGEANLITPF